MRTTICPLGHPATFQTATSHKKWRRSGDCRMRHKMKMNHKLRMTCVAFPPPCPLDPPSNAAQEEEEEERLRREIEELEAQAEQMDELDDAPDVPDSDMA